MSNRICNQWLRSLTILPDPGLHLVPHTVHNKISFLSVIDPVVAMICCGIEGAEFCFMHLTIFQNLAEFPPLLDKDDR